MEEGLGISEIQLTSVYAAISAILATQRERELGRIVGEGTIIEHGPDLGHVAAGAGETVNALDFESEEVDRLDALVDDHWDCGAVALKERFEREAEDGLERGELRVGSVAYASVWLVLWWRRAVGLRCGLHVPDLSLHCFLWRWTLGWRWRLLVDMCRRWDWSAAERA